MRRVLFASSFLCTVLWASVAGAASTPEAEKILVSAIERAGALESYTCKVKTEMIADGQKTEMAGTLMYMKPGYLMMASAPVDAKSAGGKMRVVSDGNVTFNEIEQDGAVVVVKSLATPAGNTSGMGGAGQSLHDMLVQFQKIYDFQLALEGEGQPIDGQAMNVLRGKCRKGSLAALLAGSANPDAQAQAEYVALLERVMDSIRLSIGKEDSLLHQFEVTPASGGESLPKTTTTFHEIQLNPALSPNLFNYTPPEGAQVIDTTRPQKAE